MPCLESMDLNRGTFFVHAKRVEIKEVAVVSLNFSLFSMVVCLTPNPEGSVTTIPNQPLDKPFELATT